MTCVWPVSRECLPNPEAEPDRIKLQAAVDAAVSVLWALTGRRFGCCPTIVRPCPSAGGWVSWTAVLDGGMWRNVLCGCESSCSVTGPRVVHLPGPVCSVTEVQVDGTALPSDGWKVEGDRLYRLGGVWPGQDLQAPAGSVGTWSVEYLRGEPPPAGAATVVGVLAGEFFAACTGGKCRMPRRVQTVTRQGVTVQMVDPSDIYESGATGISEVDLWVAAVNPHRHRQPPVVSSPDYLGGVS